MSLLELGYGQSYPTMTRQIRARGLRPACEPCHPARGRAVAVIEHPAGQETQWDWVELPDPPPGWGWGKTAHLLVGALSHSGKWRGVLCESEDQPHLIDALDRVAHALGGLTLDWRFDRMATVISPNTGRVSASFAAVAKHYAVTVRPCPPRRGNRKGVVEKANHVAAQRFWRTLADDVTVEQAQARLDAWCAQRGDARVRATAEGRCTVAELAAGEVLAPMPTQFPALLSVQRVVSAQALVAFRGNRYSVPPNLHGATVTVTVRLDGTHLDIATTPTATGRAAAVPTVIARHLIAPTGSGVMIRDHGHVTALNQAALNAATTAPPHRSKQRRPPTPAARAEADTLRARTGTAPATPGGSSIWPVRRRGGRAQHPANNPASDGPRGRVETGNPYLIEGNHPSARPEHQGDEPVMTPTTTTTTSTTADPATPAQASLYQQLRGRLAVLRLHDAAEHLPAVLDTARDEQLSVTAALERLLAIEVQATEARRLTGRLRFASLPTPARLADIDYDAAPSLDRALITEPATGAYLHSATNDTDRLIWGLVGISRAEQDDGYVRRRPLGVGTRVPRCSGVIAGTASSQSRCEQSF